MSLGGKRNCQNKLRVGNKKQEGKLEAGRGGKLFLFCDVKTRVSCRTIQGPQTYFILYILEYLG